MEVMDKPVMLEYIVERVTFIDDSIYNQLRNLLNLIDDEDMDKDAVADMIDPEEGLFCIFCENVLQGFIYGTAPVTTYPKRAYLFFAALHKSVPRKAANTVFDMLCDWSRDCGATHLWGWTQRDTHVLERLYGFKDASEKQIRKEL